jgi:hypothetical protein
MPRVGRHLCALTALAAAVLCLPGCSTLHATPPPASGAAAPAASSAVGAAEPEDLGPGIQLVAAHSAEAVPPADVRPCEMHRDPGDCSFRWDRLDADIDLSCEDYENFYTCWNLTLVGLGVAVAAPLANTSADESIRNWYQSRAHSRALNDFANVMNYGAPYWMVVPFAAEGAALFGLAPDDYTHDGGFFEWGNRSIRALAVGYPPVLAGYVLLGASRPGQGGSEWRPFNDWHGVSGHTFDEAIPFLTAAAMTDDPWLKVPLFLGSFAGGWARIHADQHYFSQVVLGWWMAYLAVRRVDDTQRDRAVTFMPGTEDGPGVGVLIRY